MVKKVKSPKVSVIIPNWNGLELLKHSLPSLKRQIYIDFEVIIVDNGSVDGSVKYIKQQFPEYRVIELPQNVGFAPAVNKGILAAKGEYLVLINNDTKVDKNCLKFLVETADKLPVDMIAAKMINFYKAGIIDSAGDYIDAVGHANNIGYGQPDGPKYNQPGPLFLVTGGGCLIKRRVVDKIGLLDEDYFAYFEDVDFGFRAQLAGFKAWYEPKAVIYHVHKATSNRNKSLTEYWQFRNLTMTVIKNFPNKLLWHRANWLRIILVNLNTVRYLATQGYLKSALKAEWYILTHLDVLWRKRQKIQSLKVVDDQYIIDQVLPKKITLFGLFKNGI